VTNQINLGNVAVTGFIISENFDQQYIANKSIHCVIIGDGWGQGNRFAYESLSSVLSFASRNARVMLEYLTVVTPQVIL